MFVFGMYNRQRKAVLTLLVLYGLFGLLAPFFLPVQIPIVQVAVAFIGGSVLHMLESHVRWSVPWGVVCLAPLLALLSWHVIEKVALVKKDWPRV